MLVGGGLGLVVGKQCFSVAHREPKDEVQKAHQETEMLRILQGFRV